MRWEWTKEIKPITGFKQCETINGETRKRSSSNAHYTMCSYHVRFVSSFTVPRSTASAINANRNSSAMRRGSAAVAAVSAGDDDDDEDDCDEDDEDEEDGDAEDDVDDCVDGNGLESERAAMEGDNVEATVDGFADLIADANEMGSADAVRFALL